MQQQALANHRLEIIPIRRVQVKPGRHSPHLLTQLPFEFLQGARIPIETSTGHCEIRAGQTGQSLQRDCFRQHVVKMGAESLERKARTGEPGLLL
jgi:hypothetical protein